MPFTDPYLDDLLRTLHGVSAGVRELRAEYTPAQLAWKPGPKRWSMLECIDHLLITAEGYHRCLRSSLDRARMSGKTATGSFRPSWFGRWFIRMLEPGSPRIRTFKSLEPAPPSDLDLSLLDRFLAQLEELAALLQAADGLDLAAVKFRSPTVKLVRFSIGEGFAVVLTHHRRHLQQARGVALAEGFPTQVDER